MRIEYELAMYAGAADVDEIWISGAPSLHAVFSGGLNGDLGTAGMIANLIPLLPNAPLGLLTMRNFMPLAGRGIDSEARPIG